ncbi:MAG: Mrp/NBP35 family ATP-binding protein [Chloroflexota bacterium]|nr:Mrp/NBP35 family ATP-binding protein [Chloroflexota bacterium]MDE2929412.1 Mrp/NBP35 family ATP-binding protein [Chloroflexota bacterium]
MAVNGTPQTDDLVNALRVVQDPDLHKDIVTLNMVREMTFEKGTAAFQLVLTTPACPMKEHLENECRKALLAVPGVQAVEIDTTAEVAKRMAPEAAEVLMDVKNVLFVASGKGGVGKSTTAVNLAIALAQSGAEVGLLDADVYGPNIPMMMGSQAQLRGAGNKVIPAEAYGITLMSAGFVIKPEQAMIWRGPIVHRLLTQFLGDVHWGERDYLVVDLPPGTGDAPLSLAQSIPGAGAVIVCTPQDVALSDARKAIGMFQQLRVPILGIVENMSYFLCPHCDERTEIFSHGGARQAAEAMGVPFLGEVPLNVAIREGGDSGKPITATEPDSSLAAIYREVAGAVAQQISIAGQEGIVIN